MPFKLIEHIHCCLSGRHLGRGIGVPLLPLVRRQAARGVPHSYDRLKQLLEAQSG